MTIVGMADHLYDGVYVIKQGVTVSLHFYYSMGVGKKRQRGKTKKKKKILRGVLWNKIEVKTPGDVDYFLRRG